MDCGSTIVYCVAHPVGCRGFDEALKRAAHGGTVVNKKESGPGHKAAKVLGLVAKNNTGIYVFSHINAPPLLLLKLDYARLVIYPHGGKLPQNVLP